MLSHFLCHLQRATTTQKRENKCALHFVFNMGHFIKKKTDEDVRTKMFIKTRVILNKK